MAINIKEYAEDGLREARDRYIQDLEALSEDQLALKPGGSARSAFDFTYEVVVVNRRFMTRLRGETPPVLGDGWIVAPVEFCSREVAISQVRESMDDVLNHLHGVDEAGYEAEIQLASGAWSLFRVVTFLARHANYHDAQLNYLQAMSGDGEVHWA